MRTPPKSFLQVSFFSRGEFLGSELFTQSTIIVGGHPTSDLQLDDPRITAKHAVIVHDGAKVTIKNLSKSHRTLVNDRAVSSCAVDARDKISLGSHELRIALVSPRSRPTMMTELVEDDEPETVAEITPVRPFQKQKINDAPTRSLAAPPRATPPPAAVEVHSEEDEDEEEEQRPGYSLVQKLICDDNAAGEAEQSAVEIIGWSDDQILMTALLSSAGESYKLNARDPLGSRFKGLQLARLVKRGEAVLEVPVELDVAIVKRGKLTKVAEMESVRPVKSRGHAIRRIPLSAGVVIKSGTEGYLVRYAPRRALAAEKKQVAIEAPIRRAFGSALAMHIVIGAMVGLSSSGFRYEEPKEQWAELEQTDLRNVEIQEPPPPPEEEKKPEPEVAEEEVAQEEPEEVPVPKKEKKPKPRKTIAKTEEVKSKGILGALGKMTVQAPGRKSLVAAASNLNAVSVPGGGGFRVGALISKAPASGISVGGGGGGKLLTRGTASLIRDGNLVAGIAKKSGSVRGKVGKASSRLLKAKGSISREEVARVINDHIREVQYCYEKTLISNAGTQGKLVIEWAIDPDGQVSKVRQKMSTLQGPEVFECISSKLRNWRFPKPQGGVVIVSYPFIFNSVGF